MACRHCSLDQKELLPFIPPQHVGRRRSLSRVESSVHSQLPAIQNGYKKNDSYYTPIVVTRKRYKSFPLSTEQSSINTHNVRLAALQVVSHRQPREQKRLQRKAYQLRRVKTERQQQRIRQRNLEREERAVAEFHSRVSGVREKVLFVLALTFSKKQLLRIHSVVLISLDKAVARLDVQSIIKRAPEAQLSLIRSIFLNNVVAGLERRLDGQDLEGLAFISRAIYVLKDFNRIGWLVESSKALKIAKNRELSNTRRERLRPSSSCAGAVKGVNSIFFLKGANSKSPKSVFKPKKGERGFFNPQKKNKLPPRMAIAPGKSAFRECIAYLLGKGLGVPPTYMTHFTSEVFEGRDKSKWGSVQKYQHGSINLKDVPKKEFNRMLQEIDSAEVLRMAILDLRLLNTDRGTQNILCSKNRKQLIPIDHGLVLSRDMGDPARFCWIFWRHSRVSFNKEEKALIFSMDPERDAQMVRTQFPSCPVGALRTLKFATCLLQEGVRRGFTAYTLGWMYYHNMRCISEFPAPQHAFQRALDSGDFDANYRSEVHLLLDDYMRTIEALYDVGYQMKLKDRQIEVCFELDTYAKDPSPLVFKIFRRAAQNEFATTREVIEEVLYSFFRFLKKH